MFAVCSTESIHDIAVCVRSKGLGELFLARFHLFLGGFVGRIFFLDSYRLAFLFRIETEVLEKKYLSRFECCCFVLSFGAILCELNRASECSGYCVNDLAEAEFSLYFAFRFAHVAHDNERTAFVKDVFESRQRTADTGVVCNLTVFVQWYIEIHTYNRLLAGEFVIFNSHNCVYFSLLVSCLILSFSERRGLCPYFSQPMEFRRPRYTSL